MSTTTPATTSTSTTPTTPIIIHHLNNSRSQRIIWLCEELSVNYEVKRYERVDGLAPPELKALHPLGKSPVITDGKHVIAESGAIVEYLIGKYDKDGRMTPSGEDMQLKNSFWSHFSEGSLMPPLVMTKVFNTIKSASPWFIRPIATAMAGKVHASFIDPTLKAAFDYIESEISQVNGGFFLGDKPTSSDFMIMFPLEAASQRASHIMGTKTKEYVKRMHSRAQYKRGLERGGEYAFASPN